MFCKFCGQNVPDDSTFCPECGKKLKIEKSKEAEIHRVMSAPLALMLIVLCQSTVYSWGRVLLFGYQVHIGTLIPTVMLVVGLVLLGNLIGRGRIHTETYRFSDLLVLCCVWMVVPALTWRWKSDVVYQFVGIYGQYAYSSSLSWENSVAPAIQFSAFWLVLGVIVLGITRTENWKPTKKQKAILFICLLMRSALGFGSAVQIAASMDTPMEVIAMMVQMTRLWSFLCWLWPLLILKVFLALGEDRIGTGGAAVSLLGMQLGEAFLLPIFVGLSHLGVSGCALANGLAPMFGLLILWIAARLHKKKTSEMNNERV